MCVCVCVQQAADIIISHLHAASQRARVDTLRANGQRARMYNLVGTHTYTREHTRKHQLQLTLASKLTNIRARANTMLFRRR